MKINQEQTQCNQCKYYFGKNNIHCAIYPFGKETMYCKDWEKSTTNQKIMTSIKSVKNNFSHQKAAAVLLCIATLFGESYYTYQNTSLAINADKKYERYTRECNKFLIRAGTAGTTGIATGELKKAVSYLKDNYSNESFEYRDLKSNLNYLAKQPKDLLVPIAIKESINHNTQVINKEEIEKRESGQPLLRLFHILLAITIIVLLLILIDIGILGNNDY